MPAILVGWRPGSGEWGWWAEERDLEAREPEVMARWRRRVRRFGLWGIDEPILLGDDRRVWDGHHRLVAASQVGFSGLVEVRYGRTVPSPDAEPCGSGPSVG